MKIERRPKEGRKRPKEHYPATTIGKDSLMDKCTRINGLELCESGKNWDVFAVGQCAYTKPFGTSSCP